jgi:hypothetical protein
VSKEAVLKVAGLVYGFTPEGNSYTQGQGIDNQESWYHGFYNREGNSIKDEIDASKIEDKRYKTLTLNGVNYGYIEDEGFGKYV